jgi:dipeptidyl aminopeptidase/acylaminoacyl peptidase
MRAVSLVLASCLVGACGGAPAAPAKPTPGPAVVVAPSRPAPPSIHHALGHPADTVTPKVAFFQNAVNSQVKLSPDGKHLVWLAPRNNVPLPMLASIDDLKAASPIATDTTRPVTNVFWTADGTHILYFQDPNGDGNSHVFRYDLAGGKVIDLVPIKGARVDLLGIGPRKPNLLVVGINDRDPSWDDIYDVDIKTGDRKRIFVNTEQVTQFTLDNNLVPRVGMKVLADGSAQLLLTTADSKLVPWDTIPAAERDTTRFLGIDPTDQVGWMTDSRDRDTAAMFAVDLRTKKRRLLAEDAHVDAVTGFVDPATFEIAGVGFNDLRQGWKIIAKKVQPDAAALDAISQGAWEITSATRDGAQWLVQVTGDIQPSTYYLYDRKARKAKLLMTEAPALDVMALSPMQAYAIPARDGARLVAYATVPREHDPDHRGIPDHPLPAILMIGPDPSVRLVWTYNAVHQWLAARGYVVITTNTRGASGFGKAFAHAGDRQWGRAMQDDLVDVVRALVAKQVVDPAKVCIAGISYGGYAALTGLERDADTFACGIDILGPTDLAEAAKQVPLQVVPMFVQHIGDPTTPDGLAALKAISPVTHADAITKPILLINSAEPGTTKQAQEIIDLLVKHHAPVTYLTFPDEAGGSIDKPANSFAMLAVFEAYLSEQLGGPFEPMAPEARAASSLTAVIGGERVPGL